MKRAGVRFSEKMFVSFEYNEDSKEININVIEDGVKLTGSATLEAAKAATRSKTTVKK